MNIPVVVIVLGLMVFLAHALDDLFARTKVPDVLLLLGLGLVLGPATGLVRPESIGAVGPIFTTTTLVIILFEGGLGLDLRVVAHSLRGATGLTLWNFLGTLVLAAPVGHQLLDLTWLQALTFAACLGGTSSAVVIPLVQRLTLGEKSRAVLALESALSDVLVIVVALGLMNAQAHGSLRIMGLLGNMLSSFTLAGVIGASAGLAWSLLLTRVRGLSRSIFTTPAFVFVVFGVVELLGYSGAIAALVMGIVLGNLDQLPLRHLRRDRQAFARVSEQDRAVFAEVVFLLKTFLFVYVGLSIQLSQLSLVLTGLAITGLLFGFRIAAVHASLTPTGTTRFEAAVSGALGAKGLAAAVVASIPLQMGLAKGLEIKLAVFAVVLFSILGSSVLVFVLERGWMQGLSRIVFRRYP